MMLIFCWITLICFKQLNWHQDVGSVVSVCPQQTASTEYLGAGAGEMHGSCKVEIAHMLCPKRKIPYVVHTHDKQSLVSSHCNHLTSTEASG